MDAYESKIFEELTLWQRQLLQEPTPLNRNVKKWQQKYNSFIPQKVHDVITAAFRQMCKAALAGSKITTEKGRVDGSLQLRERAVEKKITIYSSTAAAEGGITGAAGIFLGLADFPLLFGIKMKMLFEISSMYGFNTSDYKERLFLVYIFLFSFSSHEKRREIYLRLADWSNYKSQLPDDIHDLDWRILQEEYRNYTDLIKLPQLIPVIGAPFGAVINYQLAHKLGKDAMNAYRMRWFKLNSTDPQ
jgi:uncharacterized protein (DUF697 family)